MLLGRVIGSVVSTQKDDKMRDMKLLLVQRHDARNRALDDVVVCVDAVGAGLHEMVLFCTGSSARQTKLTDGKPCDAVIMAIVDSWDVGGEQVFHKEREAGWTAPA
ncbi:MAG: EutN/CcmL family microcompartment protein [Planctomycetes bacterium]|nr:EutN/CcmL family microcompartment protein [Planctomycetota bacterium]